MLLLRIRTGPDMVRVLPVPDKATIQDALKALAVDAPELAATALSPAATFIARGKGFHRDEPAVHAKGLTLTLLSG